MRGICVHEKEDLLRPAWVDDKLCYGEEKASFRVSVCAIRLILNYGRKCSDSHT